ncbi:MAG: type I CRISPR-associated protein Cas8a1/Csx8 [Clostridium sp.]|nr:type I CRISPR-associated protein Cas8a1/Csx8 [Clostridium sp.]
MKLKLDNDSYDTLLLPVEWRFSAALVGIVKYFAYWEEKEGRILHEKTKRGEDIQVYKDIGGYIEGIKYNQSDITEERYLLFCEDYFKDEFPHVRISKMLGKENYTEEQITEINKNLKISVMKQFFENLQFDGTNECDIFKKIEDNRIKLIKHVYIFRIYKAFFIKSTKQSIKLDDYLKFTKEYKHCRLIGYTVDEDRKSNNAAYRFDKDTFVANDIIEFDFIPFAFPNTPISFFLNDNCDIDELCATNITVKNIMEKKDENHWKTKLINGLIASSGMMAYDVEVIMRDKKTDVFETFYINPQILSKMGQIKDKLNNIRFVDGSLNVEDEVFNCCIKGILLDSLLEKLLVISFKKEKMYASIIIEHLISINIAWKGVINMNDIIKRAKDAGYSIGQELGEDKAKSYKIKLTSAILAHDYKRLLEIMLQLSAYRGSEIRTIYDLIDNKEDYSDIAICFTNALVPYDNKNKQEKNSKDA